MPSVEPSVMIVGLTTKTVRDIDGRSVLKFYVEENLDLNLRYLANKTINQPMRFMATIIMGVIAYEPAVMDQVTQEEVSPGKYVVNLKDISLIFTNRNSGNGQQALNLPWLIIQSNGGNRSSRTARGATPKTNYFGPDGIIQKS